MEHGATAAVQHSDEVASGQRFEFGRNWRKFLAKLTETRISEAETSLCEWLSAANLEGRSFLDIGSGSGLFSLAARRLGARVASFDYDPQSVACTAELKRRYFPDDPQWTVGSGSALNRDYLGRLGTFDIVYSWGVLHHTGAMWQALGNVIPTVAPGGQLFISIYNDQGKTSNRWRALKHAYVRLPRGLRFLILGPYAAWSLFVKDLVRLRPLQTFRTYRHGSRGMSPYRDAVDWIGGYPFEVATPEAIFEFYHAHGFQLEKLKTWGGKHGTNEFVFRRVPSDHRA
jgi:2-polyprenyl-6-hydroxyphenyl methylase/3-demethylubiquinone-9 3-methyltransferase